MSHDEIATVQRTRSWPMWLFVVIALLLNVLVLWFIGWVHRADFGWHLAKEDGSIAARQPMRQTGISRTAITFNGMIIYGTHLAPHSRFPTSLNLVR
jgi:hypothetical protein